MNEGQKKRTPAVWVILLLLVLCLGIVLGGFILLKLPDVRGLLTGSGGGDPVRVGEDESSVEDAQLIQPDSLPEERILWQDDFSSGISSSWRSVEGEWRTVNGYLVPASDEVNSIIVGGDPEWSDYTVEVTIKQMSELYFAGAVLVHVQDENNYLRATVYNSVLTQGTYWEIVRDGVAEEIPGTENSEYMNDTQYDIRIVVSGSSYQLYVNGELHSSFTETTFSEGYIGLQSFGRITMNNPHLAGFGNLVVTEN